MQLFVAVLTEGEYAEKILKKLSDNNFHGSVMSTQSIKHALMESVEPEPYFGGLNQVLEAQENEYQRPMIFVVVKKDEDIKVLSKLANEAIEGIKGKGFMYSVPITYLEGIDD